MLNPRSIAVGGVGYGSRTLVALGLWPADVRPDVEQPKQGGVHGLRAQFRRIETEEQKRLRREAQGIIQRIKRADPEQSEALLDDSKDISRQLQEAIAALEALAAEYQAQLEAQQALHAQEEARALRSLLIEAQLQAELLQQQVEELDVAYIIFMLAAHA